MLWLKQGGGWPASPFDMPMFAVVWITGSGDAQLDTIVDLGTGVSANVSDAVVVRSDVNGATAPDFPWLTAAVVNEAHFFYASRRFLFMGTWNGPSSQLLLVGQDIATGRYKAFDTTAPGATNLITQVL